MFNKILQSLKGRPQAPASRTATQPAADPRPLPLDVTDATFAQIVLDSDRLAVVDCWAEWCEPCHVMSAAVGFLAADYADRVLVTALDVDANPETPGRYAIMGLPTLLFFRNGEEVGRQVGVVDYETLRQQVEHLLQQDSALLPHADRATPPLQLE